ncbi:MAG: formylglycine-generating enzyme family protein [Calditrichaeota bacterium]|nr:formylglycine-generating enzyme family protein [Calditrichota bacterium]
MKYIFRTPLIFIFISIVIFSSDLLAQGRVPIIDTVFVKQNPDTKMVEINYSIFDLDQDTMVVLLRVSADGGQTFRVPAQSFSGDYGLGIVSGDNHKIYWDAMADYPEHLGENYVVKLWVSDDKIDLTNLIPGGIFNMGMSGGVDNALHSVETDTFWLSPREVTNEEYRLFCDITDHPYPTEGGTNQAPVGYFLNYPQYPVVGVSWWDAIAYCNWLSELAGLDPCYDLTNGDYDSSKTGFHLPTEAQREKAARGDLDQMSYPWGNDSPISRANYNGYSGYLEPLMADFGSGRGPLPVDSLTVNGYFLKNMAGNVWEWCNDWYNRNYYDSSPPSNPLGPETGTEKVVRGGAWNSSDIYIQCAFRERFAPEVKRFDIGFRVAR